MSIFAFGSDARSILNALEKSQAIIEFDLEGRILHANENFLQAIGYQLSEIVGQHHRMFVTSTEANSPAYKQFWRNLAAGNFDQKQYKRIAKGGREIWIEATYNPVFKGNRPYKVIKFATDITAMKLKALDAEGKLTALDRAQAIIEFTPTGEILHANENFLSAMGYTLSEIVGRHHQIFCDAHSRHRPSTAISGAALAKAGSSPTSSPASARVATRSTSRPPTIRSWMPTAKC